MSEVWWLNIEPCKTQVEAEYILMKLGQQKKSCDSCTTCVGPRCDIYTSSEEEARLGKYLIEHNLH